MRRACWLAAGSLAGIDGSLGAANGQRGATTSAAAFAAHRTTIAAVATAADRPTANLTNLVCVRLCRGIAAAARKDVRGIAMPWPP